MNTSPTLGRRIRHFRQRANLTLDALSDKVGLSGSQLSIIENGKREPKIGLVTSIAAALGVSVATLLETGAPDERSAKNSSSTSCNIRLSRHDWGFRRLALERP